MFSKEADLGSSQVRYDAEQALATGLEEQRRALGINIHQEVRDQRLFSTNTKRLKLARKVLAQRSWTRSTRQSSPNVRYTSPGISPRCLRVVLVVIAIRWYSLSKTDKINISHARPSLDGC